jgi:hypothetical protein
MASDEVARRKAGPTTPPLLFRAMEAGVNAATEAVIVANRADAIFMISIAVLVLVIIIK